MTDVDLDGARDRDPFAWFAASLADAQRAESFDATRAALATVTADGTPAVRYVLVKQADPRGFVFFTNERSDKGCELAAHPHAALAFHWAALGEQVRAEGPVERLSAEESDAYFASRPRGAQLSAWASEQSRPIATRTALDAQWHATTQRFAQIEVVPRPPHWGGYRLVPARIEFWRDGRDRLHDRWLFVRGRQGWTLSRLQP